MGPYRQYTIRVLVPTFGPDVTELLQAAIHYAVAEEHAVALVSVGDPIERAFCELTAYEAEEITRRERCALDDAEDYGEDPHEPEGDAT